MFYVLGGNVTFRCGDESFDVADGGFVFLPSGIEHEYTIRSDGPVRRRTGAFRPFDVPVARPRATTGPLASSTRPAPETSAYVLVVANTERRSS
jgi:hypothetical protein